MENVKKLRLLAVWIVLSFFIFPLLSFGQSKKNLDQKIGEATFETVVKTQGIFINEPLLNLVKEVGGALEKELKLDYSLKYFLVDVEEPNAFATAGGYVFVTRGLLAIINTRDELAGVMAHEISHVTERHATKSMRAGILPLVLELPANIVGALTYKEIGDLINMPIDYTSKLALSAYSRSQEKDADKKGFELARRAGFDPSGLSNALYRLNAYMDLFEGEPMKKTLFIDHPVTQDRVKYLDKLLTDNKIKKSAIIAGTSLTAVDGLIFGQNPVAGIIFGSEFLQPQIGLYCKFPEKWDIQNSPVAIAALAPDKRSSIIISIDTTAGSPKEAALKGLEKVTNSDILKQGDASVHGLGAYRATLRNKQAKYADHVTEIMWLKMSSSNVLLKIVGVTSFNKPDPALLACFDTFRRLIEDDMAEVPVVKLKLKEVNNLSSIDESIPQGPEHADYVKLLQVLNGINSQQNLPTGNYLKVLEVTSLLENVK